MNDQVADDSSTTSHKIPTGLWVGFLVAIVGDGMGAFIQTWVTKASPKLEPTAITFQKVDEETSEYISINSALREISRRSDWTATLGENISFEDLTVRVRELNITVRDLRQSSAIIPEFLSLFRTHEASPEDGESDYITLLYSQDPDSMANTLATISASA